jgi:hypothetical protein
LGDLKERPLRMHRGVWEGTIKIDLKDVSFQDYGAGYNPMAFLLNTVNI